MTKPTCFNRPAFKDTIQVQDGWEDYEHRADCTERIRTSRRPRMVEIPDPMSKGCQQHTSMGEATLHPEQWDCAGCQHLPDVGSSEPVLQGYRIVELRPV